MVSKHPGSQNEEDLSPSSSSLNTSTYQTVSNYPSSLYSQSGAAQTTYSSDMLQYNNDYLHLANYNNNNVYGENPQVNYTQSSESYPSYSHAWSDTNLPVQSYGVVPGYSGSSSSVANSGTVMQPTRNASYPPASYSPSSTYNSYPLSNNPAAWNASLGPLPNTHPLPQSFAPSSSYTSSTYPTPENHHYRNYLTRPPSSTQLSTPGSTEGVMLSPYSTGSSLALSASPTGTPPDLGFYSSSGGEEEPYPQAKTSGSPERENRPGQYSHREQLQFFKDASGLPSASTVGPFIPQQMYKPHTNSDRRRYVEEIDLDAPIYFWMDNPGECGISLSDALHSRVRRLVNRDQTVFEGRGPSVSIRLEWPGYRQWSRQIPTRDFRTPPGPITKAKLAKNVAKCVQRFIAERQNHLLEDESYSRWRVGQTGSGNEYIKLEDLILVSMHHVSMGSWQPQLRLARALPGI